MFQPPGSVPFASIGPAEHEAAAVQAVEKGASLSVLNLLWRVPCKMHMSAPSQGSLCGEAAEPKRLGAAIHQFALCGMFAGTVLLKNIASGSRSRMLPLDKHAKERIVVAGPMVRDGLHIMPAVR